jgi:hypothetical protein
MRKKVEAGEGYCWAGHWARETGRGGEKLRGLPLTNADQLQRPSLSSLRAITPIVSSTSPSHSNPDSIFNPSLKSLQT